MTLTAATYLCTTMYVEHFQPGKVTTPSIVRPAVKLVSG